MINSVLAVHVHELFSTENNVVYEVPMYQREYSWRRDQWDELFDDFVEDDNVDGHFLGTIICVNKTTDTSRESLLELIDGQQRITTLSLLLAAVYSILLEQRERLSEDEVFGLQTLKRMLVLREPVRLRLRPQSQNYNAVDFSRVMHDAGLGNNQVDAPRAGLRRVKKAFQHFRRKMAERAEATEQAVDRVALDLLERTKRAQVVKLEVANYSDAFVLFESLNNRGMPLTPIDLIKNSLLSAADRPNAVGVDTAYSQWSEWVSDLGDDYTTQERFFRQYYNAMKDAADLTVNGVPVATRSNLIKIYEQLINRDLPSLIDNLTEATAAYSRLLGKEQLEVKETSFDQALRRLARAQGSPSYILLLFLLIERARLGVTEAELEQIATLLTSFFVRRNLTGYPATYVLSKLFMDLIDRLRTAESPNVVVVIREELVRRSASDDLFYSSLHGQIYEENSDLVRFVLIAMAEETMTKENTVDLWARDESTGGKLVYRWSIEHILPQGANLPVEWTDMLGGPDAANVLQQELVHKLGNLTITGYNSSLSNKGFLEKRDRNDSRGNPIGYRNGLSLNSDLASREYWDAEAIDRRTDVLASRVRELFRLAD